MSFRDRPYASGDTGDAGGMGASLRGRPQR